MTSHRAPEERFLVELVRAFVDGRSDAPPPPADLDWPRFRDVVVAHRLLLSVWGVLDLTGAPEETAAALERIARAQRLRAALMMLELERFLPALDQVGARPLVLKGAALSRTVYREGTRLFADLDVLVDRSRLEEATRALARFGYAPARLVRHETYYDRHHFHRVLRSESGINVELHWDLSRPADYVRMDIEGMQSRARALVSSGVPLHLPAHEDQLLHAASQALREGFRDLRRVVDAALLLRAGAGAAREVAGRAVTSGLGTPLWVLLGMTREVAGVAEPGLETALRPGGFAAACLQSLDLADDALARHRRPVGVRSLVASLCSPGLATGLSRLQASLFPGEAGFLDDGHHPDDPPGHLRRAVLSTKRLGSLLGAGVYQAWRLASHGLRRSA